MNPFSRDIRRAQRRARPLLRRAGQLLLLVVGIVSFIVSVRCFLQPARLLSGGVTGTALLMTKLFRIPVGLGMTALNIPIFLIGFRYLGRRFGWMSAFAVLGSWILADFAPFPPITEEPMLAAIFGGALTGVGSALALKSGGSLGGFDILGIVVNRRFSVGVGEVLLVLNGGLVVAAGITGNTNLAMYTLMGIFSTSWTMDALLAPRPRRSFLVMTRRPDQIRQRILSETGHGITILDARGAYTGEPITALFCVVTRPESNEMAELVREEDPDAFVAVLDTPEVYGKFRTPSAAAIWRRLKEPGSPKS